MKHLLIIFLLFSHTWPLQAQGLTSNIAYSADFQFREGLYLHFTDWKCNAPLPKAQIITLYDTLTPYFFENLLSQVWVSYYDEQGQMQQIRSSKVFGYCQGNLIFTKKHDEIGVIGAICLINEVQRVTPIQRQLISLAFPLLPQHDKLTISIIDFTGNRKLFYNRKNMEEILRRDPVLFSEYERTKGRWRDKMHPFIARYNQRHPIYFPTE